MKQYSNDGRCVALTGLESQRSAYLVLALQACATMLGRKGNVLDTARRTADGIPLLSFVVLFFSLLIKFALWQFHVYIVTVCSHPSSHLPSASAVLSTHGSLPMSTSFCFVLWPSDSNQDCVWPWVWNCIAAWQTSITVPPPESISSSSRRDRTSWISPVHDWLLASQAYTDSHCCSDLMFAMAAFPEDSILYLPCLLLIHSFHSLFCSISFALKGGV